ncbi:AraC family transcriptional regulator [Shewanella sp. UCD-KL12]|uniref:AraC family transcriptional regulator n=1 Tax=Shewanella sp. UCD-KL12 TaxID=1917163 RepID=UPI000970EC59|nr:AraC family transcriptional regulator [Shewanella sp. UCD-KL12]
MKFNTSFIRSCYLHSFFLGIEQRYAITPHTLSIPQSLIDEPMSLIPFSELSRWIEQIEVLTQDENMMVKIADYLCFSKLDIPGINFLGGPDLAMSVRRINYAISSFHSGASYYVIQSGKIIKWCYRNPYAFDKQKSHDSLRVAIFIFNALRHFLGQDYQPLQIHISGPVTNKLETEALFGCNVIWNAAQTELWIDTQALVMQSIQPQPEQKKLSLSIAELEQYLDMPQPHDTPKVLFEMVNYSRYYGLPSVDRVAELFNTSRQQLQRGLQKHGFNFNNLSGYILSNQAIKYMLENKSIEEITSLLGYANKQSFSKAFKRSRNSTPQQYLESIKSS